MATSGYFYTNKASCVDDDYPNRLKFEWFLVSQNIDNNTSTIHFDIKVDSTGGDCGKYRWTNMGHFYVDIASMNYNSEGSGATIAAKYGYIVDSDTIIINHNADGSGSFSASCGCAFYNYSSINSSGSASFELPIIAIASTISSSNSYVESYPDITISRMNPSFTHSISYKFGNTSGYIANKTTSTAIRSWIVPTSFYAEMPNSTEKTCTLTCDTYNGDTLVGQNTCTFTVYTLESRVKPKLNITAQDINSKTLNLTGNSSTFIKYKSNVKVKMNATLADYTTAKYEYFKSSNGTVYDWTGTVKGITGSKIDGFISDSRGYSASSSVTGNLINYILPTSTINIPNISTSGTSSITIKGNYWSGSFGKADNTLSIYYRYKEENGAYSEWLSIPPTIDSTNKTYLALKALSGYDYKKTYIFQVSVADELTQIISEDIIVSSVPVFDWGKSDFNFNVPVNFAVDSFVKGKKIWTQGNLPIYGAIDIITTDSAGVTESKSITYPEGLFTETPVVFVTPVSAYPEEIKISVANYTKTGFTVYLNRSRKVSTYFMWVAIGI